MIKMITEDYCNFDIAKLLKEKGFNEPCGGFYVNPYVLSHTLSNANNSKWDEDKSTIGYISAPTLQMAIKWLRNDFNLNPVPYALSFGWAFDIFDLSDRDITGCKKLYSMDFPTKNACYETYEEACEAAIKYCLENLI